MGSLQYFENGKKSAKRTYRNGFFIDTGYSWYENGTIQKKIAIRKNLPQNDCEGCNGTIFDYDSSGFLKERYTLQNGIYEGVKMIYEKNGTWLQRTYKNDRLNGATKEFVIDEKTNDTTIVKGQYSNDLEEGTWEFFNLKEKSKVYITYNKGKLNGERKMFDKNGILRVKGIIKNDLMEGELFHYDSLGKLKEIEVFKMNKLISKKSYD
jgi:antitoxin component YwqK of YwqJK toxin-antitoxin module